MLPPRSALGAEVVRDRVNGEMSAVRLILDITRSEQAFLTNEGSAGAGDIVGVSTLARELIASNDTSARVRAICMNSCGIFKEPRS